MTGDEFLRAGADARRAELARSAGRRRARGDRVRTLHLHLWWAVRRKLLHLSARHVLCRCFSVSDT